MATEVHSKRRRVPSGLRFPTYDLDDSIEVARRLHSQLGGTASAQEIAARLDYSGTQNGAFINRMAAARTFGLIDGPGGAITLTRRAREIVMPEDDDMELRARSEAFEAVPLFSQFYESFQGRPLPERDGLINALQTRFGVPADRAPVALDRLMRSATQAGYFRTASDRLLRPRTVPATPSATTLAPAEKGPAQESAGPPYRAELAERPMRGADHLLVRGALAELPDIGTPWSEDGLEEWLALVEHAARVIFKLPRRTEKSRGGHET
jgi:hypothetical protein